MARYDVFRDPEGRGFVLDVQSDIIGELNVRTVVPLMPLDAAPKPAGRLNPVFEIGEAPHAMVTQYIAAVPVSVLGAPVTNLGTQSERITAALDMLFFGF